MSKETLGGINFVVWGCIPFYSIYGRRVYFWNLKLLNGCLHVVAIYFPTARHDFFHSTGLDWLKRSHSDSCLINITGLTVMIFWQKRENPTVHILFRFFHIQRSHTKLSNPLREHIKFQMHKSASASKNLLFESSQETNDPVLCLSQHKWISSLSQMSETRVGKTPGSAQSAQVLWIFPSPPFLPTQV